MSKIPNNSYPIPRSLKQHPLWIEASVQWRAVLDWIMDHAVYKEEGVFWELNGRTIHLKKGQCAYSVRQIAEDCKVSKNYVEGAIKHFLGFNKKGKMREPYKGQIRAVLVRQEFRQDGRHKVRQEKSVVDVLCDGYFENGQTTSQTTSQTGSQTRVRQESDINKKDKKESKKETTTSATDVAHDDESFLFDLVQAKETLEAFWNLFDQDKAAKEAYKKKGYGMCWKAYLYAKDLEEQGKLKTTLIQAFVWGLKNLKNQQKPLQMSVQEKIAMHFSDGVIYENAECGISSKGIWFHRGQKNDGAEFADKTFWPNFYRVLANFGINNPFKTTINIKEA